MRHATNTPKTLTDIEQLTLLRETSRSENDMRDHMLFAIALGTGLRVSELVALDVADVKNGRGAKGVVTLRAETTKGNRGGEIALPERLRRKLSRFLRWKEDQGESTAAASPLFCSRGGGRSAATSGSRLSKRAAQAAFKAWQQRLGFDRTCNFHMLRHTFCTNLWKATGDLRLVQQAARHASPTVTSIYTHATIEDLTRAVQGLPC